MKPSDADTIRIDSRNLTKMLWESTRASWLEVFELARSTSPDLKMYILVAVILVFPILNRSRDVNIRNVPIHGHKSAIEPTMLLQSRFVMGAKDVIASGYKKVYTHA